MAMEESSAFLQKNHKYLILVSVGLSSFMAALDGSVVNTVLPVIRQYFNSDVATIEWTVVIYLLVLSSLLLSFGRLGDMLGHKRIFIAGFGVFVISSMLCGLSVSAWMLVTMRAIQAFGAAMMAANSPAILTKNFPPNQRGQALGLGATMTYLGLVTGPSLGGMLAQHFGWRSIFYINVPVSLIGILFGIQLIPKDHNGEQNKEPFDLPGALLFSVGLIALLFSLNQGHAYGWGSGIILGGLILSGLLLAGFIAVERRTAKPMLDLSLFNNRIFSLSSISAVLNYISLYSITFLMPFYLIQGRGLNPAQAGLLLTAQPLLMAITAPLSGSLSDKIGTRLPAMLGMAILAVGLFLLSRLTPVTPLWYILLSLATAGTGIGIFISPNNSALMGAAPRNRQGIAAGVLATARSVGMVLGVGIAGAILTTVMAVSGDGLFQAIRLGYLAAMLFAILGGFASAVRKNG